MWNRLFRNRENAVRMSNAVLVQDQAHDMLRQMMLPLIPERRVKGALDFVARETGLPYSKLRKIYYRLTQNILHFEFKNISDAYKRAVIKQERLYREEAERLATLIAEREIWERQHGLVLSTPHSVVEASATQSASHA